MPGTRSKYRASYVVWKILSMSVVRGRVGTRDTVKGRRLERGEYGGIVFGGHPQPKVTPSTEAHQSPLPGTYEEPSRSIRWPRKETMRMRAKGVGYKPEGLGVQAAV